MEPTLQIGQRVLVNRIGTHFGNPSIGDIVVFHPPKGADNQPSPECGNPSQGTLGGSPCGVPTSQKSSQTFIKRVVAGPGDVVAVRTSHVYRNGKREADPYIRPCASPEGCDFPRKITVPAGMYFIVGDNRGESDDSRHFGPVKREWIVGRAVRCHALYFACSPAE
jgi:signal peptidase I